MPLYDLQGLTKLSLRQLNLSPVGQTANPLEPGYYAEIVNQGSLKNPGAGQYPAGYYQGVTIPGWITEASDTTARDSLAAAYDSSANLTYAIDGYTSIEISLVTAYLSV